MLPLILWGLCASILTLFPFDFAVPTDNRLIALFLEHGLARRVPDVCLNVLLFVPLGAILRGEGQRRSIRLKFILLHGLAACAVTSLSIELLQIFLVTRFPSLLDVLSNTAGAAVGMLSHHAWAAPAGAAIARLRRRATPAKIAGLLSGFAMVALLISAALQTRTRLNNWNESYPLVIGNELTGDRSWRGRVFAVELTDAATPASSLRLFAYGGAPEIPGVRVAAFTFSGFAPYRDAAAHVPDFNWTAPPSVLTDGAAAVSERAWLRTDGAAIQMVRSVRDTNAFTLRVICASDGRTNERARILSNSLNGGERNFSLEQRGNSLVFRLRTRITGHNASHPEISIDDAFADERPRHVLITYDGASLQAVIANAGVVHGFVLDPGSSLAAAWVSYLPASELQKYRLTYVAIWFLPAALLVVLMAQTLRSRLSWGVLWVLGFTVMLEATLAIVSGRSFDWANLMTTAIVGALLMSTAMLMLSGLADQGCRIRECHKVLSTVTNP